MPTLADQISSAILAGENLSFPGLAEPLAEHVFKGLCRAWAKTGYGTERWLTGSAEGPRDIIAVAPGALGGWVVEPVAPVCRRRLGGLEPAQRVSQDQLVSLNAAFKLLSGLPRLGATLGALVRSVHILEAEPGFDVSHSDPQLPFSIFVSVPDDGARDGVGRLAESILHEAMHLQLSLVETHVRLFEEPDREGYSPWKCENRPLRGRLHGLYVFGAIAQVLPALARTTPGLAGYAGSRLEKIAGEVQAIDVSPAGLAPLGMQLWIRALGEAAKGAS